MGQTTGIAFPSAYGGGSGATGGSGGTVYHVTNLLDDGSTGSFRWAIAQPRPAIIVFDVSGTIACTNYMIIQGANLTIAGQTAPVGGITFTFANPNYLFRMWNVENMIVRYIRIRYQSGQGVIGLDVYGNGTFAKNLIFDHVSIGYAGWTGFGLRGSNSFNVTFQNGLIAECKTGSIFGDSDTGFSTVSYDNSMLNNFWYNTSHRFPNPNSVGRVDVINNVVQNPFYRMDSNTHSPQLNHINNYVAAGSWTGLTFPRMNRDFDGQNAQIYTAGNIIDKGIFTDANADNKLIWSKWAAGSEVAYLPAANFTSTQWALINRAYPIKTAAQAYNDVTTNQDLGASKSLNADGSVSDSRDANDIAYFTKIAEGEGAFESYDTSTNWQTTPPNVFATQRYTDFIASISSTPVNTRAAGYNTNGDGIPDVWRAANMSGQLATDLAPSGYTWLEEFLNKVDYPNVKAFPTAEGAGANTTGGRGGTVVHVTNLNDSGAGSFKEALNLQYPRIIVFDVSGTINITETIQLNNLRKDVTVLGQTAPEGGITITGGRIWFEYCDNVIFRYIKFRNGNTSNNGDCLSINRTPNVMLDHCSFAYGLDESADLEDGANTGSGNVTMQNCLVAESHTGTIGGTSWAGETNWSPISGDYTWVKNVFINTSHRFPKYGGAGNVDVINNVVHNWTARIMRFDPASFNLNEINNYYQSGSNSTSNINFMWVRPWMSPQIYTNGNFISTDRKPSGYDANNRLGWTNFNNDFTYTIDEGWFVNTQLPLQGVAPTILTAADSKTYVLANAGARHYLNADGSVGEYLDNLDTMYLGYLETDSAVSNLAEVNYGTQATGVPNNTRAGYYNLSKSADIPEVWYDAQGLTTEASTDLAPDGYMWIEKFANSVDTVTIVGSIPVITLTGASTINLNNGDTYTELGATATDVEDGSLTSSIVITGTVNTAVDGTYYKYYNVADSNSNNAVQIVRTINVTTPGGGNITHTLTELQKGRNRYKRKRIIF